MPPIGLLLTIVIAASSPSLGPAPTDRDDPTPKLATIDLSARKIVGGMRFTVTYPMAYIRNILKPGRDVHLTWVIVHMATITRDNFIVHCSCSTEAKN